MKINSIYKITIIVATVTVGSLNGWAQQESEKLKQEVEVSKNYRPTILEVDKINDIPKIEPEATDPPTFDYSIFSKPIYGTFDLTPVPAAKMVGDPRPELENGLLKLGMGNYLTTFGELFYNAQPDKNSNFGMHFRHLASGGEVTLLNDDRVKIPQSENSAEIFGHKFFRKSTLSASLGFDRKAFRYYGYPGDFLFEAEKLQMIPYFRDRQHFTSGRANLRLKSGKTFGSDINYDLGANYQYLITKTDQKEHNTHFSVDLSKNFDNMLGILNTSLTYYMADGIMNRFSQTVGQKQQILMKIDPSVMWSTDLAKLQVGINIAMLLDDDTTGQMYIYPKIKAEWSPVENILTLFAGIDGHLQHNTYSTIAAENPYVNPFHDVAEARFSYIFSGGIKGKLTSRTNYVTEASYSLIKDQHFYYNESTNLYNPNASFRSLDNTFSLAYDDVKVLKISAQVLHAVSENFSLRLSGNFYDYEMETLDKPWHMPNLDATFSGIYRATDKLKFTTDLFFIGSRTALISEPAFSSLQSRQVEMDPIIDLNVGADYQITDKFNFFVKLNNFGFQKYEQWLGYTNKGLNGMAGISYLF